MTERLYYQDPTLLAFEATISKTEERAGTFRTCLDRSAFYPTSGGQSHDLGMLNGIAVIDVLEDEAGDVWHVSTQSVGVAGGKVSGHVDSRRRWKNRQQHTAQHILSQVCIQLGFGDTVSVHLGEEYGAVELTVAELSVPQLLDIEARANEIIAGDLPVEILFLDADQLADTPLRKIPARTAQVRVIKIGEFDWSACGGTHCLTTGEVRLVKRIGTEKMRGHLLVKFLAGDQAFEDYRSRFEIVDRMSKAMTCAPDDLPVRMDKLISENRELAKRLLTAQRELLPTYADKLAIETETDSGLPLVVAKRDELDPALLSELARLTADRIAGISALVAGTRLVVATSETSCVSASNIIRSLSAEFGLKGGGNDRLAQAGGNQVPTIDALRRAIKALIGRG